MKNLDKAEESKKEAEAKAEETQKAATEKAEAAKKEATGDIWLAFNILKWG